MNDKEPLKKSILSTLALFAAQDQAVTLLELQKSLVRAREEQTSPGLLQLENFIAEEMGDEVVGRGGLYALADFSHTIKMRADKYLSTTRLFKKAERFARGLRHLPYVRAAAISGSSAQMNARDSSDIDLFIIVEPGHIFTARFLVSAYFQILGMRRYGTKITSRFCLNHYVTVGAMLPDDHTLYTAMLYSSFLSLFGSGYIKDFWQRNLAWISQFFLQASLPQSHVLEHAPEAASSIARAGETLLIPLSGFLEKFLGRLQKKRIHESRFVVVSERELAFHPDSKGQRILESYEAILAGLGQKTYNPPT